MKAEQANIELNTPQDPFFPMQIPTCFPLFLFSEAYLNSKIIRARPPETSSCKVTVMDIHSLSGFQVAGRWHLLGLCPTSQSGEGVGEHDCALIFIWRKPDCNSRAQCWVLCAHTGSNWAVS